jgi:hypothetical protein
MQERSTIRDPYQDSSEFNRSRTEYRDAHRNAVDRVIGIQGTYWDFHEG